MSWSGCEIHQDLLDVPTACLTDVRNRLGIVVGERAGIS